MEEKPCIEAEKACLNRLKALRTDLCSKIQKNDANDAEVVSARNLYMSERYRSPDDYPNQIKLWQESFTKNLIDNGDNNPTAGTTMAFKVLKPYFGNDLADLDYTKLQDGSIINDILNKFRSCDETNPVTKIKYIGFFERLIKFLTESCKSPEHGKEVSNEDLISRDIKLKSVYSEIQLARNALSKKKRGAVLIQARRKSEEKNTCK